MHRVLLDTVVWGHRIELLSYNVFLSLGILLVFCGSVFLGARRGLTPLRTFICLLVMGACMIAGSRIFYMISNIEKFRSDLMLIFEPGMTNFALYGGLILALASGVGICKVLRIDIWRLVDAIAPALGIGIASVRVGCFLNGCCFGVSTTLPWGIVFPFGSAAYNHQLSGNLESSGIFGLFHAIAPVHPTQLYEMAAALIGAAIALIIMRHRAKDGVAFLSFAIWFTAFRWLNNGLRVTGSQQSIPDWVNPIIYGMLILAGIVALRWRLGKKSEAFNLRIHGGYDETGCIRDANTAGKGLKAMCRDSTSISR